MRFFLYPLVALLVILGDQLSKGWILRNFYLGESREVVSGLFNLVYVTNPGAAFSMLADVDSVWRHYFFLGVGAIALVILTVLAFRAARMDTDGAAENRGTGGGYAISYIIALAMIAGGAIGNIVDRIRFGEVVDFLSFYWKTYHWPAFNVADSAICVGAGLYLLVNILENSKQQRGE